VARHPEGWAAAATGATVVGSRAAAWMPAPDLAAVVVLDEHDPRYRDERRPRWHARDVAVERARRSGVPCLLVSPTPSLEALVAGRLLVPSRTEERAGWPLVEIIDRRRDDDPTRQGLYSPALVRAIRGGERVGVVINRTGRARLLACGACGELATCSHCGRALAAPEPGRLACPRCAEERPAVCEGCGSTRLRLLRPGVSRVREELEALLREPIGEVTAAGTGRTANSGRSTGGPGGLSDGGSVERVVVGTEALLHRVRGLDVVAFVDIDADLCAPRFRAPEQVLGQLALAARLVGGRAGGGRLVVQTRQPDHEVVQAALHADPGRWARVEAGRRRQLHLPPFAALAQLGGSVGAEAARTAARVGLSVHGPFEERYLVRAPSPEELADGLAAVAEELQPAPGSLRVDVDPPDV
jgi:primosomal protein N' (replication factor Y)